MAKVRGSIYEGLAFAFSPPGKKFYRAVESKLLQPLKSLQNILAWPSLNGAVRLSDLVGKDRNGLGNEIASIGAEYHRLFVGPYKLLAPPYASIYLDSEPTVMGGSTLEVLRMYQQAGFVLSPSFRDLPDHIVAEFAFMALLCEEEGNSWEREDFCRAEELLGCEAIFLEEHLTRWIPTFSSRLCSSTDAPFYRALASLAADYVLLDRDHARALLVALQGLPVTRRETRDGA